MITTRGGHKGMTQEGEGWDLQENQVGGRFMLGRGFLMGEMLDRRNFPVQSEGSSLNVLVSSPGSKA